MTEARVDEGRVDEATIARTERWFVQRGLPHFIFRYSATRDVFTRAVPLLIFIALVEIVANAPSTDFPVWVSVLVALGALAAAIAVWAVVNRARGHPALARPADVGPVEVGLFVVLPALVPIVTSGQWRSGLATAVGNLVLLGLIYLFTSYGIVPMTRRVATHGARRVMTISGLLVRALPLLLLVVIVVFYTVEPFQIAHELPWELILLAIGLFALFGALFATIRVPRQVSELEHAESWEVVRARVQPTPAAGLCDSLPRAPAATPALSRREWVNVGLVVLASEGVVVLLVAFAMFVFLVVLGVLTVPVDLARTWIGAPPDVLLAFTLAGTRLAVTTELLMAAGFLAGFTGLQFTVSLLSEGRYQEEFLADLREELRESLAARAVYLQVMIERVGRE